MDLGLSQLPSYGLTGLVLYIIFKDIFPKLFPQVMALLSKRISMEERLFRLLEKVSENDAALAAGLIKLEATIAGVSAAMCTLSSRLERVEDSIRERPTTKSGS